MEIRCLRDTGPCPCHGSSSVHGENEALQRSIAVLVLVLVLVCVSVRETWNLGCAIFCLVSLTVESIHRCNRLDQTPVPVTW